jgi:hypothetical protein
MTAPKSPNASEPRFHLKWYKRDPNVALTGMADLTLEERGALNTVLDLIYANGGWINDDDWFIAGWCRVHVRVWRRLRHQLLACEKIYINGSTLRNSRADWVIDAARHKAQQAANAAQIKHEKSKSEMKVLKGLGHASAQRSLCEPRTQKNNTSLQSITSRTRASDEDDGSSDEGKTGAASNELETLIRRKWIQ